MEVPEKDGELLNLWLCYNMTSTACNKLSSAVQSKSYTNEAITVALMIIACDVL